MPYLRVDFARQTRRRRGLVNTYRLLVTPPPSTRAARVLEPDDSGFSVEEQELEEDEGEFDYSTAPLCMDFSERPVDSSSSGPRLSVPPPSPAPRKTPRPPISLDPERDAVLALIGDLRRELGDRATLGSTTSRALNLYRQSDVPWEAFVAAVYSARAATQARTSAIKRRDEGGVNKMPYMLAVLADRLGLRETPTEGAQRKDETYPGASAVVMADGGGGAMTSSACLPADPAGAARRAFWGRIAVETGIGDLRAYCRACGRPPRYDDLARSVGYVREHRGARTDMGAAGERRQPCAGQSTPARGFPLACRAGDNATPSPHSHAAALVVGGSMDGDARASPRPRSGQPAPWGVYRGLGPSRHRVVRDRADGAAGGPHHRLRRCRCAARRSSRGPAGGKRGGTTWMIGTMSTSYGRWRRAT